MILVFILILINACALTSEPEEGSIVLQTKILTGTCSFEQAKIRLFYNKIALKQVMHLPKLNCVLSPFRVHIFFCLTVFHVCWIDTVTL